MRLFIFITCIWLVSCSSKPEEVKEFTLPETDQVEVNSTDSLEVQKKVIVEISDTSFVQLNTISTSFKYDFRYATENNFLKEKVYECQICLLRKEVATALNKANIEFQKFGYTICLFDCYRPLDVQKKMWEIYPDGRYVANPHKNGSIHNRGGAVDVTLVDTNGIQLDMGTDFDHFGKKAHHDYKELPDTVLANRIFLAETLEKHGFARLSTEWWHYNFGSSKKYPLSNFPFICH